MDLAKYISVNWIKTKNPLLSEKELPLLARLCEIMRKFESHWIYKRETKALQRLVDLNGHLRSLLMIHESDCDLDPRCIFFIEKMKKHILSIDPKVAFTIPRKISDDERKSLCEARDEFIVVAKDLKKSLVETTLKRLEEEEEKANIKDTALGIIKRQKKDSIKDERPME